MSEREEEAEVTDEASESAPRLRRRLLGYKRADVENVLESRSGEVRELEGELDTREAELVELRQDIAALWLAFAQHDRMIKGLSDALTSALDASAHLVAGEGAPQAAPAGAEPKGEPAPERTPAAQRPEATPASVLTPAPATEPTADDPSVGQQLADLDDVLAAIEMATQTLEQTYSGEIETAPGEPEAAEEPASDEPEAAESAEEPAAEEEPKPGDEGREEPSGED